MKTGFVTLRALTALTLAALAGCSAQSDDGAAGDEAEINVDQAPVTTGLTELRAGQPYVPGIDESPLAIGDSGCVSNPKVSLTGGDVTATANVVTSRNAMGRELGLDLSGIPIPVGGEAERDLELALLDQLTDARLHLRGAGTAAHVRLHVLALVRRLHRDRERGADAVRGAGDEAVPALAGLGRIELRHRVRAGHDRLVLARRLEEDDRRLAVERRHLPQRDGPRARSAPSSPAPGRR